MGAQYLFVPAGIKIGSTRFSHIGEPDLDNGLDDLTILPSGDNAPALIASKQDKPKVTIENHDLAGVLDLMTTKTWLRTCAAETAKLFYRKVATHQTQVDETTAEHVEASATNNAMWHWTQIQANQGDVAKISTVLTLTNNGLNAPLVLTPSSTIEAPIEVVEPWTLGPVVVNGTTVISDLTQLTWDQQPEVQEIASGGEATPAFAAITAVKPVIKFDTLDLQTIAGFNRQGHPLTSLTVYFRRCKAANVVYTDGSSKHLKLYTPVVIAPLSVGVLKWSKISGRPSKASVEIRLQRSAPSATLFAYAKNVTIV